MKKEPTEEEIRDFGEAMSIVIIILLMILWALVTLS